MNKKSVYTLPFELLKEVRKDNLSVHEVACIVYIKRFYSNGVIINFSHDSLSKKICVNRKKLRIIISKCMDMGFCSLVCGNLVFKNFSRVYSEREDYTLVPSNGKFYDVNTFSFVSNNNIYDIENLLYKQLLGIKQSQCNYKFKSDDTTVKLSHDVRCDNGGDHKIIGAVSADKFMISYESIAFLFKVSKSKAYRIIKSLYSDGLIYKRSTVEWICNVPMQAMESAVNGYKEAYKKFGTVFCHNGMVFLQYANWYNIEKQNFRKELQILIQ